MMSARFALPYKSFWISDKDLSSNPPSSFSPFSGDFLVNSCLCASTKLNGFGYLGELGAPGFILFYIGYKF
jgi:hypothetical protein